MGYKIVTAKNVHYICKYVTGYIKISIILAHSQMMIANNGFGVCFKKKKKQMLIRNLPSAVSGTYKSDTEMVAVTLH